MKTLIHIILILMVITQTHATFQIPEKVMYKNSSYETLNEPLASYIEKNKIDITKITQSGCSANWRGYVATWVVQDNYLYLKKLFTHSCGNEKEVPLVSIIPKSKGMVKAVWYSGELKLFNNGKVHSGEPPTAVLIISSGQVVD